MTSQEWEKYHNEEDSKLQKKVRKLSGKSTRRVYAGAIMILVASSHLGSTINQAGEALEGVPDEAGKKILQDYFDSGFFMILILMVAASLILLMRAAALWNRSEEVNKQRLIWMPTEEEKKDIEARFDNEFVHFIMSRISLRNTESVKVSLDGINIRNNTGDKHCNFNKNGFKGLSNYETKQLAYYIADKKFTEGFTILQSKKYETVYTRYAGGVTEVGGAAPKKQSLIKTTAKNIKWISSRVTEILRVKHLVTYTQKNAGPGLVEGGQIILNKGYMPDDSEFKTI